MKTKRAPKKPEQRRAWIKYQLDLLGFNLSDIARDLGITRQGVYRVFAEPRPRVEKAIADRLGLTPAEIWPERYPSGQQHTEKKRARQ